MQLIRQNLPPTTSETFHVQCKQNNSNNECVLLQSCNGWLHILYVCNY